MKRLKIQTLLFAALVGLASTCFVSCGSSNDTSMSQQVKQYFDKDISLKNVNSNYSAYFDLSDGVVLAYKNQGAADFLNATVQRLPQFGIVQATNPSCLLYFP